MVKYIKLFDCIQSALKIKCVLTATFTSYLYKTNLRREHQMIIANTISKVKEAVNAWKKEGLYDGRTC